MSLTSHLKSKDSPVRRWFEERFANTAGTTNTANAELRGSPPATECLLARYPGADAGLVGTAVDYLLRAVLRESSLERLVASNGVLAVGHLRPELSERANGVLVAAVERIRNLAPWRDELGERDWRELCRMCLVLARFEQLFRSRAPAGYAYIIEPLAETGDLDAMAARMLAEPTIDDLAALARPAAADHADLRAAKAIVFNPTFAMSVALGGADADIICDGLLLDWKSSASTGIIGRLELWQLLGYVLADTDDDYGIGVVGISALRWRHRVTWPLTALLAELSNGVTAPLAELRAEFSAVIPEL